MSDYIKREDAIFIALQQPLYSVVSQIKQLDGIDIVRCKECRYGDTGIDEEGNPFWKCLGRHYGGINPDDFCSYGERAEQKEHTEMPEYAPWKDAYDKMDCGWK